MGTNYYLHEKEDCPTCGRPHEAIHIGKSSGGWCFSLHVIPEDRINTLDDWKAAWSKPGTIIRNEYGERITAHEMLQIITDRSARDEWPAGSMSQSYFGGYYTNEADFHRKNSSQRGPKGLLRHLMGTHCVGHGEGTWDYIRGEFS